MEVGITNTSTKKLVFLYVGQAAGAPYYYEKYSATDISNYGVSEFVINVGGYSVYKEGPFTPLISTPNNSNYEGIKELVNRIINISSNNRVWIATPSLNITRSTNFSNELTKLQGYIDSLRTALTASVWNTYVNGIYMNYERIINVTDTNGDGLGEDVDYNNLINGALFGNKQIKLMNDLSNYVKSSKVINGNTYNAKQFMWCPYYGYNYYEATIIKDIGYVANTTNIFNVVLIQPAHYFQGNLTANLNGVRESIRKGYVCWRDGVTVVTKTSSTQIGCQMEVDSQYFTNPSVYQSRYQDYLNYFNNITNPIPGFNKNNYLFSYYCGAKNSSYQREITNLIRSFYGFPEL